MAELKPCPFCGGEAKAVQKKGCVYWTVICTRCPCELGAPWFNKYYAEHRWNTRTQKERATE